MRPASFTNTTGAINNEEKVVMSQRMAHMERTIAKLLDRVEEYEQTMSSMSLQLTTVSTTLAEFQHRYGSGEGDNGLVVRQKESELDKEKVKALKLTENDIMKVNMSYYYYIVM